MNKEKLKCRNCKYFNHFERACKYGKYQEKEDLITGCKTIAETNTAFELIPKDFYFNPDDPKDMIDSIAAVPYTKQQVKDHPEIYHNRDNDCKYFEKKKPKPNDNHIEPQGCLVVFIIPLSIFALLGLLNL